MDRTCLFIGPLKDAETVTRNRYEDVFASLVSPAAYQAGFKAEPIFHDEPGTIINHIVGRIKAAWVVVADLTGNNFSVGYELALAHMLKKPTIPILKLGSAMPYDVQTMRAVTYEYTDNRSTLRSSIPQLAEQLRRTKVPYQHDNPLQNALRALEPPKPATLPVAAPIPTAPPPPSRPLGPPSLADLLAQPTAPTTDILGQALGFGRYRSSFDPGPPKKP